MSFQIIDIFRVPYIHYNKRVMKPEEIGVVIPDGPGPRINTTLICNLTTPVQSAFYAAQTAGTDNGLTIHIKAMLDQHPVWSALMPSVTPPALLQYQQSYANSNLSAVSAEINQIGKMLTDGQYLFHGGLWPTTYLPGSKFTTIRPLSTTLCPNVAFNETLHNGKAYDSGRIDILVLKVKDPQTKVFAYDVNGADLGHEQEAIFAEGAVLTLVSVEAVGISTAGKCAPGSYQVKEKTVPVYIIEAEIS
ncbi:hypothetical protein ERD95_05030 [Enterobacteriaceae bacterium ML5]|nr:hypothetical protein ERD95_05030 [Enterobacteriaceae bacterium ML5]